MSVLWVALGILGLLIALSVFLATRQSAAGIVTSRWGRMVRLWLSTFRATGRIVLRKFVGLFQSKTARVAAEQRFHEETAKRAFETMGQMKGALMKLGQIVSFMDESLPPEYREQLRKLQAAAPPMDYEVVDRVIRAELGRAPDELFAKFSREPIAAASIGQVHRATLLSGEEVVVKVQYPGVDKAIAADLENVGMLIGIIGAVTPTLDAKPIAEELRSQLLAELDYVREAENQAHFAKIFAGHTDIVIPKVYPKFSTGRVLTSEFISGEGFYSFLERATREEKRRATLAIHAYVFHAIYNENVFNGDPHPGNYLFMKDGRVAFLDYGSVKYFDPTFMKNFRELNFAYFEGDRKGYFDKACEMGFIKSGHEHKVDGDWLWDYSRWFYLPIVGEQPFALTAEYCRKSISQIFGDNMRKLNMPADYVMLNRITFGLNSILAKLDACEKWRDRVYDYYIPKGKAATWSWETNASKAHEQESPSRATS